MPLKSRGLRTSTKGGVVGRAARFLVILTTAGALSTGVPAAESRAEEPAFLPTWKLLNRQEKQHFMAGYLQGWRAAAKVSEITSEYIRENPDKAVQSLDSLRGLYDMSGISPESLVVQVDEFYSEPSNQNASLSVAVTAARAGGMR